MTELPWTTSVCTRLSDVPAASWNACAGDDNPFVCHQFLSSLEESRSASGGSGWLPQHILVHDRNGMLVACAPLYLKSHSYGEYVFDWSWAQAFERAGGEYYPKLQCCVPFTPATGPRLLVSGQVVDAGERQQLAALLVKAMLELCERRDASSLHVTFPREEEAQQMGEMGLLVRCGVQYHWENRGCRDFNDFLDQLSSRKRKTLRKEREKAAALGVRFHVLSGEQIEPRHRDAFYSFYLSTVEQKWAHAYLQRSFFDLICQRMPEKIVLVMGEEEATGQLVCGAINFRGKDTLYGRNWGALGDWKFLHFEACYYQAMDYAIAHGLRRVEAGAQGEHKIQRGYLPQLTWSAHWIVHPGLRQAVARAIDEERQAITGELEALRQAGPYRQETL